MKNKFLKISTIIFFSSLMLTNLPAYQEMRLSQDINNLYKRIYNRIPPSHKNKVLLAVKSYEERISSVDSGHDYYLLAERTIQNFFPTTASSIDMSQAVFVVLVKATNDMDDDIRAIMDEIKKMTAAKQKLRDKTKELNSWISEEMSNHPNSEDIENEPVSSKETDKRPYLSRTKIDPKMRITHNYKVKFYKTPVIKPNPNLNKMPLNELKKRLQQSNEELRNLINLDNATRSALRPLSEKRNKLFQIVLNLSKKV